MQVVQNVLGGAAPSASEAGSVLLRQSIFPGCSAGCHVQPRHTFLRVVLQGSNHGFNVRSSLFL